MDAHGQDAGSRGDGNLPMEGWGWGVSPPEVARSHAGAPLSLTTDRERGETIRPLKGEQFACHGKNIKDFWA